MITKEALKQLIGVDVVVHLHGPWWLVIASRDGLPMPAEKPAVDKQGRPVVGDDGKQVGQPVLVPVLTGVFVEHDGVMYFQYPTAGGAKVEVLLNLSDVLSVTRVVASRIVT